MADAQTALKQQQVQSAPKPAPGAGDQPAGKAGPLEGIRAAVTLVVALLLVLGGSAMIVFLVGKVSSTQSEWDRYIYLLGGVEAVVFAAIGWFFGKEVHREQAQAATKQANTATQQANTATQTALAANQNATAANAALSQATESLAGAKADAQKGRELAAQLFAYDKGHVVRANKFVQELKIPNDLVDQVATIRGRDLSHLVQYAKEAYPDLAK